MYPSFAIITPLPSPRFSVLFSKKIVVPVFFIFEIPTMLSIDSSSVVSNGLISSFW